MSEAVFAGQHALHPHATPLRNSPASGPLSVTLTSSRRNTCARGFAMSIMKLYCALQLRSCPYQYVAKPRRPAKMRAANLC